MRISQLSMLVMSGLGLMLGTANLAYAQQDNSIGVNAAIKGDVTISTEEQAAKQAVLRDPVFLGQTINSKRLSSLQVLLKDKTVFTVGPDCQLTIDKFVYDQSQNNNSLKASVTKGMFRFMSGNVSKSGIDAVAIDTPVSSMGIRGTMVEGLIGVDAIAIAIEAGILPAGTKVDTQGATLFVLRGPGPKSTAKNRKGEITVTSGGRTVIVKGTNKAVFVPSAGAAPLVFSLSMTAYENFSNNLRTTPTSPNTYGQFEIDSHFNAQTPISQTQIPAQSGLQTGLQAGNPAGAGTGSSAGVSGAGVGTGISTNTILFGLAAIGGAGAIAANQLKDDNPVSP